MGDFDDIKSRTYTPEYGEGHERTFGESPSTPRQAKRTRYVYRNGKMVEQGGPEDTGFVPETEDRARNHIVSDLYMDGLTVTVEEGKVLDIGSRRKRRAVMRERDWADCSDYTNEWAQKAVDRAAHARGEKRDPKLREQLGRALYEASKKGR